MQSVQSHPIMAWAVRHAAWLLTRFQARSSGKTARREYWGDIGLFGETVLFKFCGTQGKLLPRWE